MNLLSFSNFHRVPFSSSLKVINSLIFQRFVITIPKLNTYNDYSAIPKPNLSEIVHMNLLERETPDRIEEIWLTHFQNKKSLSAVVSSDQYTELKNKMENHPILFLPLRREEGYCIPVMLSIQGDIHSYSLVREMKQSPNAYTPQIVVHFFRDFEKKKGIVLMKGDFLGPHMKVEDGQILVGLSQLFYLNEDLFARFVIPCNEDPNKFHFEEMVHVLFGKDMGIMKREIEGHEKQEFRREEREEEEHIILSASDMLNRKWKPSHYFEQGIFFLYSFGIRFFYIYCHFACSLVSSTVEGP